MRRSFALVLWLVALDPAIAAGFGAVVGASTDNVYRGLSESTGDPSVQAGAHYGWDNGAFAGLRGASTKRRTSAGERDMFELDSFFGYGFSLADDWSGRAMLVHYAYPWSDPIRHGYDELVLGATWRGGVSLSAAATPNRPGGGGRREAAYNYELALRWPLAGTLSADAGVGYHDLNRLYDTAYVYWSAGATCAWRQLTLGLSWIGTDDEARGGYGETADNRVVASVLAAF